MTITLSVLVTAIVAAILLLCTLLGWKKGLFRLILATFSFFITTAATALLTTPTADFLQNSTFVGPAIEEHIGNYVDEKLNAALATEKDAQDALINALPLPSVLKDSISENNTADEYLRLQADSFSEYITKQLSSVAIKIIAFICLFVIIYIALRIILHLLKFIGKLPIIHGLNKFFGGVLGLIEGLLIVWLLFFATTLFSATDFGAQLIEAFQSNAFLLFFYENNLILTAVQAIF